MGAVFFAWNSLIRLLGSEFFLGFMSLAVLLAILERPKVAQLIGRIREKKRDVTIDEELARQCEEMSRYLYDEAVQMERLRRDQFAAYAEVRGNPEQAWAEEVRAGNKEEERIRRHIGHRIQALVVKLREHGLKLDLWGFSLNQYDLRTPSYFMAEIAASPRRGDYFERQFTVNRRDMPPMM